MRRPDSQSERGLFFLHIRKTAGSSVRQAICNQFAARDLLLDWHHERCKDRNPDAFQFVTGHCPYDAVQRFSSPPRVLVFVRDAIERALSAFDFYCHATPAQVQDYHDTLSPRVAAERERFTVRSRELGLSKFLKVEQRLARQWLSNVQARVLAGASETENPLPLDDDELLERAIRNLGACEFIGLSDRVDESLTRLSRRLGWAGRMQTPIANRTLRRRTQSEIEPDALATLREWNQVDDRLYRAAVQRFQHEQHSDSAAAAVATELPRLTEGADFTFDQPIQGRGWHPRELYQGRWIAWTGPELVATLPLRVVQRGRWRLACRVEHALTPEILSGLQITANGTQLTWSTASDDRAVWVEAEFGPQVLASSDRVDLQFSVPRTLRPIDLVPDCGDDRQLGVALSRIRLRAA